MATNYAQATYTEVIDLQTVADHVSIIGIHTPRGLSPYNRLRGFFTQFRKFRYNGIKSLVMVPAANLPVDPLGLTGQQQTTDLLDPRDMLNPILFHGCHGESLTQILNQVYGKLDQIQTSTVSGDDTGDAIPMDPNITDHISASAVGLDNDINAVNFDINQYYAKLTDSTWKKFGIQSGVKLKNLHPLVHRLARNTPLIPGYGSSAVNVGDIRVPTSSTNTNLASRSINSVSSNILSAPYGQASGNGLIPGVSQVGIDNAMFTNGMTQLSWIPTTTSNDGVNPRLSLVPKLFMGLLILPPAYNIEQFFRMVITHSFSFKDFTSSLGAMDPVDSQNIGVGTDPTKLANDVPYYNWIDYGDTTDSIGAKAEVISDGVM